MNPLVHVLRQYGINVFSQEQMTPRVWKIMTQKRIFALKKSTLTDQTIGQWYTLYRLRESKQLFFIVPVYQNITGSIYTKVDNSIYYLMPWIPEEKEHPGQGTTKDFFASLGRLHGATKQSYYVNYTATEEQIKWNKLEMEKKYERLLMYIDRLEEKRYMSPFGLEVCTQFHQVEQIFQALARSYDNYLTDVKSEEFEFQSICHGYPTASHYLATTDAGCFINWDYAHMGDPMMELATAIYYQTYRHDTNILHITEAIPYYEKQSPLTFSQLDLLAIYLLQPDAYLAVIQQYLAEQSRQLTLTPLLLQNYRRIIAGLSIQGHLQQHRDQLLEKDEEQTD
ncbi:phosphotransferase [Paraliobacillus ryukyuensis]|uniref:phosphotransferase n=1 Tax=Paraliobacillus ryukyuensis TaxID=200904 RepID=UPI0009A6FB8D|nr:phosphotransferase [Paraliobacillus ryukyuensis]